MVEYYSQQEENKAAHRAQQIYLILIGLAHNRQTATYGQIADLLGYDGAGTLAAILGRIMRWCEENGLPALTALVVNQETGLPGEGLSASDDCSSERELIYRKIDWYDIMPPKVKELA
jgi:alkylated DNA nucleotide flippase Atl1